MPLVLEVTLALSAAAFISEIFLLFKSACDDDAVDTGGVDKRPVEGCVGKEKADDINASAKMDFVICI